MELSGVAVTITLALVAWLCLALTGGLLVGAIVRRRDAPPLTSLHTVGTGASDPFDAQ